MKHHASAYLLEPRGVVHSLLAADQRRRLSGLADLLKQDAKDGVVRAMHRFSGFS
ncbi:hypothetical protein FHW64_005642 [Variovorax sp. Sphag1AA]|nr:hypothetical protein [Variovorax sp. Sphag1AA]